MSQLDDPTSRLDAIARSLSGSNAGPFCANRLFEWIAATIMLGIALALAFPGDSLARGPFAVLAGLGLTEKTMLLFFSVVGVLRVFALCANGRIPLYGPRVRAFGSLLGALIWFQIAVVFGVESLHGGVMSLVVPLYAGLTLGELVSCYRATYDAGRRDA